MLSTDRTLLSNWQRCGNCKWTCSTSGLTAAQANIDELSKDTDKQAKPAAESTVTNPTTYSSVFLRIQPFFASHGFPPVTSKAEVEEAEDKPDARHLHFLLHLHDPAHDLTHTTVSQSVPARWLPIWDDNEWVEDLVVETLRVAVEVVGQEYVVERMGWGTKKPVEQLVSEAGEKEAANEAVAMSSVGL